MAYKDYMKSVAALLIRDANLTLSVTERQSRIEQFVNDAYGHEYRLAKVSRNKTRSDHHISIMRTSITNCCWFYIF